MGIKDDVKTFGLFSTIRSFFKKWGYCDGCKYFSNFKCDKYGNGMTYGCCGYVRDVSRRKK